jgi:hypothetical protein
MKEKIKFVDDDLIRLNRRLKKLKAQKDRLLTALRDLAEAVGSSQVITNEQKIALEKAIIAIQLSNACD